MDKHSLELTAAAFVAESTLNRVVIRETGREIALFDAPLLGYASAEDPLFQSYLAPEVIGPHFRLPPQWLNGAKTVVSFFLPFSAAVRESNRAAQRKPSSEWLYGRVEGQNFVAALCGRLSESLQAAGWHAVAPSLTPEFWTVSEPETEQGPGFTSNWSERHIAYACGLGTFGLSKGLITARGMSGRFGSLVTDWETAPTGRSYRGVYDDCIRCGACVRRCPGGAISLEGGKDHHRCYQYQSEILPECLPRFGCGLCQTGVPCEDQKPC